MNGTRQKGEALADAVMKAAASASWRAIDCVVFPAFPYLGSVGARLAAEATPAARVALGAQDLSPNGDGAYTGDVSATMLADLGCGWVLVGHSERRALHGETSATVAAKVRQAFAHGLKPLICIGESLETRQAGQTEAFLAADLDGFVTELRGKAADSYAIGYEPIWAIGTGVTATPQQAQETHAFVRRQLASAGIAADQVRIVYGGSVKASNANEIFAMPDVDGGLVGGASLVPDEFIAIGEAAVQQTQTRPSKAGY